jgi:hypothetical protein
LRRAASPPTTAQPIASKITLDGSGTADAPELLLPPPEYPPPNSAARLLPIAASSALEKTALVMLELCWNTAGTMVAKQIPDDP